MLYALGHNYDRTQDTSLINRQVTETVMDDLVSLIKLECMFFDHRGNRSTRSKPTQAWEEQANSTKKLQIYMRINLGTKTLCRPFCIIKYNCKHLYVYCNLVLPNQCLKFITLSGVLFVLHLFGHSQRSDSILTQQLLNRHTSHTLRILYITGADFRIILFHIHNTFRAAMAWW